MTLPNRHGATDSYRYGFQGQEKDDEIKGEGNSLNYKYRMHDPRVGRFFAVDPLEKKYPWNSSYAFSENRVIDAVELEGLEAYIKNSTTEQYTYDSTATESNVPEGNSYIGNYRDNVYDDFEANNPFKSFFGYKPVWKDVVDNGPREFNNPKSVNWGVFANWTYMSNSEYPLEQAVYGILNGINIVAEWASGASVGWSRDPITNLDGTLTTTDEGVLGFVSTGSLFLPTSVASSTVPKPNANMFVYRSMTSLDAASVKAGNGLFAKAPYGAWTLEEHLIMGSSKKALFNNPWIATSADINIARSFSSGNGLVRIDLSKVSIGSVERGWMQLQRSSPGYHYSIWQQEVSISQKIEQSAIKIIE
ncbi:RHS repeat-associated core domain-containing protein [Algibacter sp. 2305UL17-15]|uniref:RHS repeat-associated core domain-containing protein n=1 Tax=Algibacter sp. 2305UL17-15 TaxID=3231268 RepID=UPI003458D064